MVELIIFLWIVGHMFTAGMVSKEFGSKQTMRRIMDSMIVFISWPFLLGVFVREQMDESDRSGERV